MQNFHLAWRAAGGAEPAHLSAEDGSFPDPPCPLLVPARLSVRVSPDAPAVLAVAVEPATLTLTPGAGPGVLHYFRLADGTVKPLPPAPPPLPCLAGDTYVAVTPGAARLAAAHSGGASAAIARVIHLRDYFNADRLAHALLEHLLELGQGAQAEGAAVLVLEAR